MKSPEYLRSQAYWCLEISRYCFDLGTSECLRIKAGEFLERATELELHPPDEPLH